MLIQKHSDTKKPEKVRSERGAALITVIFISLLVLTLASALILTTSMSATSTVSATDELQAYYAAEAGMQAALNTLRGNVAPTINFKNAVANPQLSQWLIKNYPTTTPNRITLSPNYSEANGMAYAITSVEDPEDSTKVIYTTAGSFTGSVSTSPTSLSLGGGVTLNYTPQPSTDITTYGSPALGTFSFSGVKNNTNLTIPANTTFTLQITESAPLAAGTTSPASASIKGTISGVLTDTTSTVTLVFNNPSVEIPNVGTLFTVPTSTAIPVAGSVSMSTIVTTPSPRRVIVKVQGYGPHGAVKNMQAMVSSFGVSYDPPATFVIRGHDDLTTGATVNVGASAKFVYSGNDNAGGQPLPAFLVTNDPDFNTLSNLKSNNDLPLDGDITGHIPILKKLTLPADLPQLPPWLQTTSDPVSGARAFVQQLRDASKQQFYNCTLHRDASCDRYFDTRNGEAAPQLGAEVGAPANGLFTFVDGDVTLPNEGGKGLLVVTGTLEIGGSKSFDGLVLVLGDGVINRSGGGNGSNLGAFVVARFGSTGGFLNPTFISTGSGTSTLQLDRNSVKRALVLGGVYTLAVSEY